MDTMEDVFFQSEATRQRAVSNYDAEIFYSLPFLLAWIGFDSVSAIFG